MKKRKIFLITFFSAFALTAILSAQQSIWRDQNPYSGILSSGSTVKILVNEKVSISSSDNADVNREFKLKKNPDKNYLEFLKNVDENESDSRKYKDKVKYVETIEFSITGILGEFSQDGKNVGITATKNISIDGKPFRVQLSGLVDAAAIHNRMVNSSDIANFVLNLQNQRPPRSAGQINLKAAPAADAPQPPVPREARLSPQEQEEIKLDYLRKAIGALQ